MPTQNNPIKRLIFTSLGFAICIIPVSVTILSYFPLWIAREDASILSGLSLILVCAALLPLYRCWRHALRSPSSHLMWFIIFAVFFLLSKIANEMTVISFVGFVTNLIGSLFFKLARKYDGGFGKYEGRT